MTKIRLVAKWEINGTRHKVKRFRPQEVEECELDNIRKRANERYRKLEPNEEKRKERYVFFDYHDLGFTGEIINGRQSEL